MIVFSLLIILGTALEGIAVFTLIQNSIPVIFIFGIHTIASIIIIYGIHQLRAAYSMYNFSIVSMLFMFIFFMPILGIIMSLILARWLYLLQKIKLPQSIQTITSPGLYKPLRSHYGMSGLRINLQSAKATVHSRIKALKVLTTLPPEKGNLLVRTVLPDKEDELRLLAFNLIDKQEKKIVNDINHVLEISKKITSEEKKAKMYKYLARQYWELVYCNLIEPAMLNFVLNQALMYIEKARPYSENDPTFWYLLGRIYIRQKNFDSAIQAFNQAILLGENRERTLPYLAEAYFYQKKFHLTKQILSANKTLLASQLNKFIIEFWSIQHV